MASGGRNRSTLPQVPQVRVTTPRRWQYAETAAVRGRVRVGGAGVAELDRHHRAATADVADHGVLGGQRVEPAAHQRRRSRGPAPVRSCARISSIAPSAAAQATGLPP